MTLSVRLPDGLEQKLGHYCMKHRITKSQAVRRALAQLFEQTASKARPYDLARKFMGSDKTPGDVARHTKRFLLELRNKPSHDSQRLLRALRTRSSLG